jgi:hypothetical protein
MILIVLGCLLVGFGISFVYGRLQVCFLEGDPGVYVCDPPEDPAPSLSPKRAKSHGIVCEDNKTALVIEGSERPAEVFMFHFIRTLFPEIRKAEKRIRTSRHRSRFTAMPRPAHAYRDRLSCFWHGASCAFYCADCCAFCIRDPSLHKGLSKATILVSMLGVSILSLAEDIFLDLAAAATTIFWPASCFIRLRNGKPLFLEAYSVCFALRNLSPCGISCTECSRSSHCRSRPCRSWTRSTAACLRRRGRYNL